MEAPLYAYSHPHHGAFVCTPFYRMQEGSEASGFFAARDHDGQATSFCDSAAVAPFFSSFHNPASPLRTRPAAPGYSSGTEIERPLAIVMVGELLTSTRFHSIGIADLLPASA